MPAALERSGLKYNQRIANVGSRIFGVSGEWRLPVFATGRLGHRALSGDRPLSGVEIALTAFRR